MTLGCQLAVRRRVRRSGVNQPCPKQCHRIESSSGSNETCQHQRHRPSSGHLDRHGGPRLAQPSGYKFRDPGTSSQESGATRLTAESCRPLPQAESQIAHRRILPRTDCFVFRSLALRGPRGRLSLHWTEGRSGPSVVFPGSMRET